eukprot:2035998-Pleurochrysis_carterae.AAC.3
MIKQSEYASIHILYDDMMKHYEYFGDVDREEVFQDVPIQTREGETKVRETTSERRTEEDREKANQAKEEEPSSKALPETDVKPKIDRIRTTRIGEGRGGKYIRTEEEILKIRPGDKLRKVTEMMKVQGVSLMTLTDTHLSQEGMEEVGKYLQQEGLGGGGIAAKREVQSEEMDFSARR